MSKINFKSNKKKQLKKNGQRKWQRCHEEAKKEEPRN